MVRHKSYKSLRMGSFAILIVTSGVIVNLTPSVIYKAVNATKNNVAGRSPAESEVYGLKLIQMLLPREGHRIWFLDAAAARYHRKFPLVNENITSALGVVGAVGLLSLIWVAFLLMSGRQVDECLAFLAIVTVFLFFFATIGGFSSLFAFMVSSKIRAWNRISVFIGFASISAIFLILQNSLDRFFSGVKAGKIMLPISVGLGLIGFFDQTAQTSAANRNYIRAEFENDSEFVKRIEAMVPENSAIYQLPYIPFPEEPSLYALPEYGLSAGFLHSKSLRWSYGGMKGREGDTFFRALSLKPIKKQLEVVSNLGFAGIYIDRRGFSDNGASTEKQLADVLKSGPQLVSTTGALSFFRIPHSGVHTGIQLRPN